MCHKRAREVKADGLRLFFWLLAELDDRSVYVTFSDAEYFHSLHDRGGIFAAAAATATPLTKMVSLYQTLDINSNKEDAV